LTFFVSNSQDSETFKDWTVYEGESRLILFNLNSKIIENSTKNPTLVIDVFKDNEGTIGLRLTREDIYRFEEDKNFIKLEFIIDDSEVFEYTSRVLESESDNWDTEIKLTRMEDEPSLFDLFDLMKKGENIYVQTTGSGDPKVWRFELGGFLEGYDSIFEKWMEWNDKQKEDNPFKKKDNNPFRR
tara:strand:- start:492 stop:1046 length:555 start_codon:yes stop_codon:yes gene_type:complete